MKSYLNLEMGDISIADKLLADIVCSVGNDFRWKTIPQYIYEVKSLK